MMRVTDQAATAYVGEIVDDEQTLAMEPGAAARAVEDHVTLRLVFASPDAGSSAATDAVVGVLWEVNNSVGVGIRRALTSSTLYCGNPFGCFW